MMTTMTKPNDKKPDDKKPPAPAPTRPTFDTGQGSAPRPTRRDG